MVPGTDMLKRYLSARLEVLARVKLLAAAGSSQIRGMAKNMRQIAASPVVPAQVHGLVRWCSAKAHRYLRAACLGIRLRPSPSTSNFKSPTLQLKLSCRTGPVLADSRNFGRRHGSRVARPRVADWTAGLGLRLFQMEVRLFRSSV